MWFSLTGSLHPCCFWSEKLPLSECLRQNGSDSHYFPNTSQLLFCFWSCNSLCPGSTVFLSALSFLVLSYLPYHTAGGMSHSASWKVLVLFWAISILKRQDWLIKQDTLGCALGAELSPGKGWYCLVQLPSPLCVRHLNNLIAAAKEVSRTETNIHTNLIYSTSFSSMCGTRNSEMSWWLKLTRLIILKHKKKWSLFCLLSCSQITWCISSCDESGSKENSVFSMYWAFTMRTALFLTLCLHSDLILWYNFGL